MYKTLYHSILWLAVLLAFAALAGCGSEEVTPAPGTAPGISVSITGNTCPSVEINVNDQVTWTNEDTVDHPIRIEHPDETGGEVMIDLGVLQPGDTASVTFPQADTYTYTCSADQAATGTITVQP